MMPENNNDPIVMYVIVRYELDMSIGKCSAQCARAMKQAMLHYFKALALNAKLHCLPQSEIDHTELTTKWLTNGSTTVILGASDKEWEELKMEFGKNEYFIIKDAGKTEVEPGTETCASLSPMRESSASPSIKRLRLL
jgi:PTH2 family peptidyl-tRNA hydrolase